MTSGADTTQIVIYDPQQQDKQFRWLRSPREMSVAPGAFAGGVLTPCVNGQVFLMDPFAREDLLAKLYAPSLKGVNTWEWQTPQAVDDKLAVLCDGDRRLIAIQLSGSGEDAALGESATALTKQKLVSPIAVLGKSVYVVDAGDSLLSFQLPRSFDRQGPEPERSLRVGTGRSGDSVLSATDKDQASSRLTSSSRSSGRRT